METNIQATFKKKDDLMQAAKALKTQGALDIRILNQNRMVGDLYALDVYVEKSRSRQAVDTILQHGGYF